MLAKVKQFGAELLGAWCGTQLVDAGVNQLAYAITLVLLPLAVGAAVRDQLADSRLDLVHQVGR